MLRHEILAWAPTALHRHDIEPTFVARWMVKLCLLLWTCVHDCCSTGRQPLTCLSMAALTFLCLCHAGVVLVYSNSVGKLTDLSLKAGYGNTGCNRF